MQATPFVQRLSDAFRLHGASSLASHDVVAVDVRHDAPGFGMTGPMPAEPAALLCLHLRPVGRFECWEDDRSRGVTSIAAGTCTLHDLRRRPFFCIDDPFHLVALRLPDAAPHDSLVRDDPVLAGLARALLPFLDGRVARNGACIDHALRAIAAQASANGGTRRPTPVPRGGLAPWQQRRAQDLLRTHLADGIPLDTVAEACSLSPSGFVRAFRQSVGLPPHQWLMRCRVDRATELMRDRQLSLSEIAVTAGFCDQSHFTRAFSQRMGLSPGAWRKAQAGVGSG